ncbi:MAG: DUF4296 domain-containing protein [Bacteroidetes bacterium]|nr:MAG: DUF4296 domain-containing protein [Bacteroidota bacterium]
MIRLTGVLCFILIVSGCRDEVNSSSAPNDLIPRDTIVQVLCEMMLIESHVKMKYQSVSRYHRLMKKSGDRVLDKFNLQYDRYDRSMSYYGGNKTEMQSIYAEVLDSLNRMSGKLEQRGVRALPMTKDTNNHLPGILGH